MTDRKPRFTEIFSIKRELGTEPSNSRIGRDATQVLKPVRIALLVSAVLLCNLINGQQAFSTPQFSIDDWYEKPNPAMRITMLENLNKQVEGALNPAIPSPDNFCYELKTEPADTDILDLHTLNCTFGDSTVANGFTSALGFEDYMGSNEAIIAGTDDFDYDARVRHALEVIAHRHDGNTGGYSTPSGAIPNKLTVTFNLKNVDEPPELKQLGTPDRTSYLRAGDQINYSILDFFEDPEGEPITIDLNSVRFCEPMAVNTGTVIPADCQSPRTLTITGNYVSIEHRGPRIYIRADGPGLTAAGFYYAVFGFQTEDPQSNSGPYTEFSVYIKNGENNPPHFKGGATGFTMSVAEKELGDGAGYTITPSTSGAWIAEDLDGDRLSHSLLGSQPECRGKQGDFVQIGRMCIYVDTLLKGGKITNVLLVGHHLDYEDPVLSANKSFTVTLRADDGWDHTDIPIEVTINDINELYLHNDPMTGLTPLLPMSVSVIEGETVDLNLTEYVTDPEHDNLTFMAYSHSSSGSDVVQLNGTNLSINGVGTDANIQPHHHG